MMEGQNIAANNLDPLIFRRLAEFSRRRRKLIVIRGLCVATATLVGTMMLISLLDWLVVLPTAIRWILSLAAYGVILAAEWRSCWRLLLHAPGERELARLVGCAQPQIREDLLSAVELSGAGSVFDSQQFRELLQTSVSGRMRDIDVEKLLPVNLLKTWLRAAILTVALGIVLLLASGFQFGKLFVRALLPMANVGRVSAVQVRVVLPEPPDQVVPQGDGVPIEIMVSGGHPDTALVEISDKGGVRRVTMQKIAPDRFAGNIQVGHEPVQYRFLAGDAITRKYSLDAVARPHVMRFRKLYSFPSYTRFKPKSVTETNGDLTALEGTEVELLLDTDQRIKAGELQVDTGKKKLVIKTEEVEPKVLRARVPMVESGTYRIHLVAAGTSFENKFSPEYAIRVEPDLVPTVNLDAPTKDLVLAANETVAIEGHAKDDIALASVVQCIRVNDGPWKEIELSRDPGTEAKVTQALQLFDLGVRAGDRVTTKLVATDLKGSRAESRSLVVSISSSGLDPSLAAELESTRGLVRSLHELNESLQACEQRVNEAKARVEQARGEDLQSKQSLLNALVAFDDVSGKREAVLVQIRETLREAPPGHRAFDFALVGRLLSDLQGDAAKKASKILDEVSADPTAATARDDLRKAVESVGAARGRTQAIEAACTSFLATAETSVLALDLNALKTEQARLAQLAGQQAKWDQLANRQRVASSETRVVEELITELVQHVPGQDQGGLRGLQDNLRRRREALDQALSKSPLQEDLPAATASMLDGDSSSLRDMSNYQRQINDQANAVRQALLASADPSYETVLRLRQDKENLERDQKLPPEARARRARELAGESADILSSRADFDELRKDADAPFIADLGQASQAVRAVSEAAMDETEKAARLMKINESLRTIESAHSLSEVVKNLRGLATQEQWEFDSPKSRTATPRDWIWLRSRLNSIPDEFQRAGLPPEIGRIVADASRSQPAAEVERKINDRYNVEKAPVTASQELEQLAALLSPAEDLLRKRADDARAELAKISPKLDEMMSELAAEAKELDSQTTTAAQEALTEDPAKAKETSQKLLAEQQELNKKVDAVKDALRRDANKQDVLTEQGRERARDADDAVAVLMDPPAKAEELLNEATSTPNPVAQEKSLKSAAGQQEKLAQLLAQLSEHYKNMEAGNADKTRAALRAEEKELGIKGKLDERYAQAEKLQEMAEITPEELLAMLERELKNDQTMQKELSDISKKTLDAAKADLAAAAKRENDIAADMQKANDALKQAEAARQAEANKQLEAARQAESARQAEAAKQLEAARQAESARQAEASKQLEAAKQAESARKAEAQKQAPAQQGQQTPEAQAQQAQQALQAMEAQQAQQSQQAQQALQAMEAQQAQQAQQAVQALQAKQNALQAPVPKPPMMGEAASQQEPIGKIVRETGNEVARAGRHEQRLDNTQDGQPLEQLGKAIEAVSQTEIPQAQKSLTDAPAISEAQPAVEAARNAIQSQLDKLNDADKKLENQAAQQEQTQAGSPPANDMDQAAQAESKWMARTLDSVDAAVNGPQSQGQQAQQSPQAQGQQQPGQGTPQAAQSQAQSSAQQQAGAAMAQARLAMSAAASRQQSSMRASRIGSAQQSSPGSVPQPGQYRFSASANHTLAGNASGEQPRPNSEWGKLPAKLAKDLSEGKRENVEGEYRTMVETYFRVIAEKAKPQP